LNHPFYVITNFRRHGFVVKNIHLFHGFTVAREQRIARFFLLTLDDSECVKTK